jgi:hypothetical protein
MLLGVRLWYGFFGTTLASAEAFEGRVGELCRGSWAITGFEAATDLSGNVCSYPLIELAPR